MRGDDGYRMVRFVNRGAAVFYANCASFPKNEPHTFSLVGTLDRDVASRQRSGLMIMGWFGGSSCLRCVRDGIMIRYGEVIEQLRIPGNVITITAQQPVICAR